MKVLIIINSLGIGGAERLVTDSLSIYKDKGVNVTLLLLNYKETFLLDQIVKSGIQIKYLSKGSQYNIYSPINILKLKKEFKLYDIIHVHLFPSLYWASLANIFSINKTKLIFTEHNTTNRRMNNFLLKKIDSLIYKQYSKIISIGENTQRNLKESLNIRVIDPKFEVIENGINLDRFFSKNIHCLNEIKDWQIIQISSFRKQKDQLTLIEAMRYLPTNFFLKLVGDGSEIEKCRLLVNELKLQDRISFLGNRDDIPQLLEESHISVLSSHYEGLSLSSIECMASGRPFIASDVPGLTEVVEGAGVLFNVGDAVGLSNIITNLANDQEYYNKIANQCIERAMLYDIDNMVNKYIEVYKEIINEEK